MLQGQSVAVVKYYSRPFLDGHSVLVEMSHGRFVGGHIVKASSAQLFKLSGAHSYTPRHTLFIQLGTICIHALAHTFHTPSPGLATLHTPQT
jgi:hypothetical protein